MADAASILASQYVRFEYSKPMTCPTLSRTFYARLLPGRKFSPSCAFAPATTIHAAWICRIVPAVVAICRTKRALLVSGSRVIALNGAGGVVNIFHLCVSDPRHDGGMPVLAAVRTTLELVIGCRGLAFSASLARWLRQLLFPVKC